MWSAYFPGTLLTFPGGVITAYWSLTFLAGLLVATKAVRWRRRAFWVSAVLLVALVLLHVLIAPKLADFCAEVDGVRGLMASMLSLGFLVTGLATPGFVLMAAFRGELRVHQRVLGAVISMYSIWMMPWLLASFLGHSSI